MFSKLSRTLALVLFVSGATGCAGYAAGTEKARAALDAGQPKQARELYNKELGVKTANDLPDKNKGDNALMVLERSMISVALDDYVAASRDLEYADKQVEMLDMSRSTAEDVGRYVFSDDTGPYRAAPYEKVMVNTMNMINYLARRDLNGARIEARRMSIMQKYLRDNENPAVATNAPGGYIAGFVFERSGRPDIALRYYDEAIGQAEFSTLAEPITRLSQLGSYSTPRLKKYLEKYGSKGAAAEAPVAPAKTPSSAETPKASSTASAAELPASEASTTEPPETTTSDESPAVQEKEAEAKELFAPSDPNAPGDLIVILNYGRVPAKIAKRIPIGLALTYASLFISPAKAATANQLAAQGLVTWVNYPELEEKKRRLLVPSLLLDGEAQTLEGAVAIDEAARAAYDKERGKIIASAITRMITRVVAGNAAGAAAKNSTTGAVISILTQATLTAVDTPDTRSWATLPSRIAVTRIRVTPGSHKLKMTVQGQVREVEFKMEPGGWQAAVMTVLR